MRRKLGFTLTEVMVVLVILSVMAGLAVPSYFRTVEQSRINEAITTLNIIHMGEKIYRLNNATFWQPGGAANNGTISAGLNIDISPTYYNVYAFSGVSANGYTLKVSRNNTQGGDTSWFQQYTWDDVGKTLNTSVHNP